MSKIITFSRFFPKGHINEGKQTYFVEKIWKLLYDNYNEEQRKLLKNYQSAYDNLFSKKLTEIKNIHQFDYKSHTIRAGKRFKKGDYFSPRVWSGKPYQSKQIKIAPDIKITECYEVKLFLEPNQTTICLPTEIHSQFQMLPVGDVSKNDGLTIQDFESWFNPKKESLEFDGQIICFNEKINY